MRKIFLMTVAFLTAQQAVEASRSLEQQRQEPMALTNVQVGGISFGASAAQIMAAEQERQRQMALTNAAEQQRQRQMALTNVQVGRISFGATPAQLMAAEQQRQSERPLTNVVLSSAAPVSASVASVVDPTIQLFIKRQNELQAIQISPNASVDDLKDKLASQFNLPRNFIKMIGLGKNLYSGRLMDNGISNNATITLMY